MGCRTAGQGRGENSEPRKPGTTSPVGSSGWGGTGWGPPSGLCGCPARRPGGTQEPVAARSAPAVLCENSPRGVLPTQGSGSVYTDTEARLDPRTRKGEWAAWGATEVPWALGLAAVTMGRPRGGTTPDRPVAGPDPPEVSPTGGRRPECGVRSSYTGKGLGPRPPAPPEAGRGRGSDREHLVGPGCAHGSWGLAEDETHLDRKLVSGAVPGPAGTPAVAPPRLQMNEGHLNTPSCSAHTPGWELRAPERRTRAVPAVNGLRRRCTVSVRGNRWETRVP